NLLASRVNRIDRLIGGQYVAVHVVNGAAAGWDLLVAHVLALGHVGQPGVPLDLPVVQPRAENRGEQQQESEHHELPRPALQRRGRRHQLAGSPSGLAASSCCLASRFTYWTRASSPLLMCNLFMATSSTYGSECRWASSTSSCWFSRCSRSRSFWRLLIW